MDDNVHMQNSVQFAYELQKAGKPFEMMVYPKSRHGFSDPRLIAHLRQTMFDFVMRVTDLPGLPRGRRASRCWPTPFAARPPSSPWSFALREPSWVRWRAWTPGSTATTRSVVSAGIAFRRFSPTARSGRRKKTTCGT